MKDTDTDSLANANCYKMAMISPACGWTMRFESPTKELSHIWL